MNTTNDIVLNDEEKNKLRNEKKKSLIKSFSMLMVVSLSLLSSIYTLFYEKEDNINMKVSVSNGIQISVDAETWKTYINNNDIISSAYTGNTNQIPNQMSAVSSAGDIDLSTGFMKMFKSFHEIDSNIESGYRIESQRSIESSGTRGDFIAFDLFVLSNEDTAVYLSNNSDVISYENSCAKNALRVAFLYQGVSEDAEGAIELKGAESFNDLDQLTNVIWEPNNTKDGAYYAINQDIKSEDSVDYQSTGDKFTLIIPSIQTPVLNNEYGTSKTLFNLNKGINKIRIYAWVEGQDSDCTSNISVEDIMYNIQISKDVQM